MPAGKRRSQLAAAVEATLKEDFEGRVLPFNEDAARLYALIVAARNALGRPISQFDAMIASIARSHAAPLATRNVNDFAHCGIRLVDPWKDWKTLA